MRAIKVGLVEELVDTVSGHRVLYTVSDEIVTVTIVRVNWVKW